MPTEERGFVVVLVHWKIKKKSVDDFLNFWKTEAVVRDREGLIGEFLTTPASSREYPWITLNIEDDSNMYVSYLNVGLWSSAEIFVEQIGQYFETETGIKPFEYEQRSRTLLKLDSWRIGEHSLPEQESEGVL